MRAWDDERTRRHVRDAEKAAAVREAGIDLDPPVPGERSDPIDETDHAHAPGEAPSHTHPHVRSGPGQTPVIGIVGGGAVGTALGVALTRAGWPVHASSVRTGR